MTRWAVQGGAEGSRDVVLLFGHRAAVDFAFRQLVADTPKAPALMREGQDGEVELVVTVSVSSALVFGFVRVRIVKDVHSPGHAIFAVWVILPIFGHELM